MLSLAACTLLFIFFALYRCGDASPAGVLDEETHVRRQKVEERPPIDPPFVRRAKAKAEELYIRRGPAFKAAPEIIRISDEMPDVRRVPPKLTVEISKSGKADREDYVERIPKGTASNSQNATRKTGPSVAQHLERLENAHDLKWEKAEVPQLHIETQYKCKNLTDMGGTPHHVCLDNWELARQKRADRPCVVYDLGVRGQPQFAKSFVERYGCVIRAYDPSEAAVRWWESDHKDAQRLRAATDEKYKFHSVAAGAVDGPTELFAHNAQPVSISQPGGERNSEGVSVQTLKAEAKTLSTMMADNSDTWMDVLKVDIEGAEYKFLQNIFENIGCPPVRQITIEFHHVDREKSPAAISAIHDLLSVCGYESFRVQDNWRNSVTPKAARHNDSDFCLEVKRYTLASYCKGCRKEEDL